MFVLSVSHSTRLLFLFQLCSQLFPFTKRGFQVSGHFLILSPTNLSLLKLKPEIAGRLRISNLLRFLEGEIEFGRLKRLAEVNLFLVMIFFVQKRLQGEVDIVGRSSLRVRLSFAVNDLLSNFSSDRL